MNHKDYMDLSIGIIQICIGLAVGLNILGIGLGLAYTSFKRSLDYLKKEQKDNQN